MWMRVQIAAKDYLMIQAVMFEIGAVLVLATARISSDPLSETARLIYYRVQFLDQAGVLVAQWVASALTDVGAIELGSDIDWPPEAVTMRILDPDVRLVHLDERARL